MGKKSKAEGKHDSLCSVVSNLLQGKGFETIQQQNYSDKGVNGEIDVAGFSPDGKYAINVEVKCTDKRKSRKKAYDQLDRSIKHFRRFKGRRIFSFYVHYNGPDSYVMNWYKK